LQKKAEEIRCKSGDASTGKCIQAKGTVVVGYPAEEILKYIKANQIDLVMLATHGRSGVRMWDLGNVANKVVHAVDVPVWLIPSDLRQEVLLDQIPQRQWSFLWMVPSSPQNVIPHAISIAKQRGLPSKVVLVWVENVNKAFINSEQIKLLETTRETMKKYLEEKVKVFQAAGIEARSEILFGEPAMTILEYIRSNPSQLVAMTTHGRSGLHKMIFGSVTETIIQKVKKTPIFLVG
jgi:nucleotide-binding universal stress UspA family protein